MLRFFDVFFISSTGHPLRWTTCPGTPSAGPPSAGPPKISRFFFPLPLPFSLFFSLSGVFSWKFGGVWSAGTLKCARLEFSGCRPSAGAFRDWVKLNAPTVIQRTCSRLTCCTSTWDWRTSRFAKQPARECYTLTGSTTWVRRTKTTSSVFGVGSARWPDGPPQSEVAHVFSLIPVSGVGGVCRRRQDRRRSRELKNTKSDMVRMGWFDRKTQNRSNILCQCTCIDKIDSLLLQENQPKQLQNLVTIRKKKCDWSW